LDRPGQSNRVGGPGEQVNPVQPGRPARLGHQRPQLQGALEVAGRLRERVGALGGKPGLHPGRQRPGGFAGRVPVNGQLGSGRRRSGLAKLGPAGQRVGAGGVQPGALAWQEVSLDDFTQQCMTEVVAVLAGPGYQQLVRDRLPERLDQLLLIEAGDGGQQPVRHLPAGHCDGRKHLPRPVRQRLHPAAKQIPDGGWQLP
jgi:hypothetical protein